MKILSLLLALLPSAQAVGSESWHFPGDGDNTKFFRVNSLELPTQWTLEAWVYFTKESSNHYWLSYAAVGNHNCLIQPVAGITLNEWQHVIMTWDGTTNKLFLNGVEKGIGGHAATASCSGNAGSLVIGQGKDREGGFQTGRATSMFLDTVALYNTAWSSSDVAEKSSNTFVDMSDSSLYGLWYDESGTDYSGNGRTADVESAATTPGQFGIRADGACFHADGTVLLESGESKRFSELSIGDVIKTSDGEGRFSFSPVLTLPHAANSEAATFLTLTTETNKAVVMTPDHFIPKCDAHEVTASELVVGDCLMTTDGKETLIEITSSEKSGVYTATTKDKFIVVDGVVASPYSLHSRPAAVLWDLVKHSAEWKRSAVSYIKKHLRGAAE